MIGAQELTLIAIVALLLCGPWIIRRISASVRELRHLGDAP